MSNTRTNNNNRFRSVDEVPFDAVDYADNDDDMHLSGTVQETVAVANSRLRQRSSSPKRVNSANLIYSLVQVSNEVVGTQSSRKTTAEYSPIPAASVANGAGGAYAVPPRLRHVERTRLWRQQVTRVRNRQMSTTIE